MKVLLITILCCLLFSCKDQKNTATSKVVEEVTQEKTKTEKTAQATGEDGLEKYGIDTQAENYLGGLKVGDLAPDFTLYDVKGNPKHLEKALQNSAVILTFYRGSWCGYCTKFLSELQDVLLELKSQGIRFQNWTVSPEKRKYTLKLKEKEDLRLVFLHDRKHEVMKDYKVYFNMNAAYRAKWEKFTESEIRERTENDNAALPVPASYVIGMDHRIKYVFYDTDYSQRPDLDSLLAYFKK